MHIILHNKKVTRYLKNTSYNWEKKLYFLTASVWLDTGTRKRKISYVNKCHLTNIHPDTLNENKTKTQQTKIVFSSAQPSSLQTSEAEIDIPCYKPNDKTHFWLLCPFPSLSQSGMKILLENVLGNHWYIKFTTFLCCCC